MLLEIYTVKTVYLCAACFDKSGTVKRIIHTSSVAAVQSYDKPAGYIFTEKDEAT